MTLRGTSVNLGNPGTIGGTTPGAITGTTLTATENLTLSGGAANGVPYLNSSKVLTTDVTKLTFDGTNLGLGGTLSAWAAGFSAFQFNTGGVVWSNGNNANFGANHYHDGVNLVYKNSGYASSLQQVGGDFQFFTAPSGIAGNAITFTTAMMLTSSGNVLVGLVTSSLGKLQVNGGIAIGPTNYSQLISDAADTLAQRNGVNAQTRRLANTFTDASNYERLTETWSSNVCYVKTEAAGTGTLRQYIPVTNGVAVASLPSAATAGAGARSFVTDANATTFASIVAGGGSNNIPVYSDGTSWRIG